jgi:hypothetical protein
MRSAAHEFPHCALCSCPLYTEKYTHLTECYTDLKEICLEDLGVDGNNLADHTLITTVLFVAYRIVSRHVSPVTCRSYWN